MNFSLFSVVASVFFLYLGFKLYQYGATSIHIAAMTFRRPEILIAGEPLADELYLKAFATADRALEQYGFFFSGNCETRNFSTHDCTQHFMRLFFNPVSKTYAHVFIDVEQPVDTPFSVSFANYLVDGQALFTVNRILPISLPTLPMKNCEDICSDRLESQWLYHLERTRKHSPDSFAVYANVEEYVSALKELGNTELESLNIVNSAGEGQPIPLLQAVRYAHGVIAGYGELARRNSHARFSEDLPEGSIEADMIRFNRNQQLPASHNYRFSHKLLFMFLSMILFTVAFGVVISWSIIPMLLFALVLHESGHMLGMMLFGYQNRQMLFVPPLGAVAMGEKNDAKAWQTLFVLLMGPIPGIVLSFLLMFVNAVYYPSNLLMEAIIVLFIINYLNLLPITPLDGGRIVELLFLSRFPRLKLIFASISVIALAAGGYWLNDTILLGLAAFLGWQLFYRIRNSKTLAVNYYHEIADAGERLRKIVQDIWQTPQRNCLVVTRLNMIKQRFSMPVVQLPGWRTFIFGGAFYLAMLALPLTAIAVPQIMINILGSSAGSVRAWEKAIKDAENDEQRRDLIIEAAGEFYESGRRKTSDRFFMKALELAAKMPDADYRVAQTCCDFINYAYEDADAARRQENFNRGMALAEKFSGSEKSLVISRLIDAFLCYACQPTSRHAELGQRALAINKAYLPAGDYYILNIYRLLIGIYDKLDQREEAEQMIELALRETDHAQSLYYHTMHKVCVDYYFEKRLYMQAVEVISDFLGRPVQKLSVSGGDSDSGHSMILSQGNRDKVHALTDRGLLYLKLSNPEKAEEDFTMALRHSVDAFKEAQKNRMDNSPAISEAVATSDHLMNLALIRFMRGEAVSALKIIREVEQSYQETGREYDLCRPRMVRADLGKASLAAFRQREIEHMLQQFKLSESFRSPAEKE